MHISVTAQKLGDVDADLLVFLLDEKKRLFAKPPEPFDTSVSGFRDGVKEEKIKTEKAVAQPPSARLPVSYITHTKFIKYHSLAEKIKILAHKALVHAREQGHKRVAFALDSADGAAMATCVAEGILLGTYRFEDYKKEKQSTFYDDAAVQLVCRREDRVALQKGLQATRLICEAMNRCRTTINETLERVNPESLAQIGREIAAANGLECDVLDEKQLQKEGYAALLAVGRASEFPPRLVVMRYVPSANARNHLCLIGKGVTFDSGGLCLKTPQLMWKMKDDMAGAATVMYLMEMVAKLKPRVRITAIAPLVHNAIDARAIVPGHVIRTKSGKTIHVINTDAEGRLILTDALMRAGEEGATHIVDVATLTGSVIRALHTSISGIFGNDRAFVKRIIEIGKRCGEDFWELPLHDEYREMLESHVADIDNIGSSADAGATTAGLFLREFVPPSAVWAHLDIAGTALAAGPRGESTWKYFAPGATGVAFRTLVALCRDFS